MNSAAKPDLATTVRTVLLRAGLPENGVKYTEMPFEMPTSPFRIQPKTPVPGFFVETLPRGACRVSWLYGPLADTEHKTEQMRDALLDVGFRVGWAQGGGLRVTPGEMPPSPVGSSTYPDHTPRDDQDTDHARRAARPGAQVPAHQVRTAPDPGRRA